VDEALELAACQAEKGQDSLRVISAGCSYGPEVDTVLALAHRNLPGIPVDIVGVDGNSEVLAAAVDPCYRPSPDISTIMAWYTATNYDFMSTMAAHGIDVDLTVTPGRDMLLRTGRLRAEHRVEWQQADLRSMPPPKQLAHLILCNNVIDHGSLEGASEIAENLIPHLAIGGILSFGSNLRHAGLGGWRSRIADKLSPQGIVSAVPDTSALTAFQRVG